MGKRSDPPPVSPLRIFVVENHADSLKYLVLYLETMGHTVLSATTMTEALEKLPIAGCEVLISDMGLPDGDGWELLRTVQLPSPIYAIAMSGFGMNADRARSKAAGYRHHLLKPFVPTELDEALEAAAQENISLGVPPLASPPLQKSGALPASRSKKAARPPRSSAPQAR